MEAIRTGEQEGGKLNHPRKLALVLALLAALLAAVACRNDVVTTPLPIEGETYAGTITDEGIECLAMRDRDGRLYTLAGVKRDAYAPGDEVCVRGEVAEMSYCMQGTTISVDWIGPAGACD
jgi:hypothetical protein